VRSALALARRQDSTVASQFFAALNFLISIIGCVPSYFADRAVAIAPDDVLPKRVAAVHQEIDSTTAAASRTEPEGQVPRHIPQLPYHRNDDLGDAISGTSRLDLNA
jgi:hypothetical protein